MSDHGETEAESYFILKIVAYLRILINDESTSVDRYRQVCYSMNIHERLLHLRETTDMLSIAKNKMKSLTYEEMLQMITSTNLQDTAYDLGRTLASMQTVRSKYRSFLKGETQEQLSISDGMLEYFKRMQKDDVEATELRLQKTPSKYEQAEITDKRLTDERYDELFDAENNNEKRDPFTEYAILIKKFQQRSLELMEEMAEELANEKIKDQAENIIEAARMMASSGRSSNKAIGKLLRKRIKGL